MHAVDLALTGLAGRGGYGVIEPFLVLEHTSQDRALSAAGRRGHNDQLSSFHTAISF